MASAQSSWTIPLPTHYRDWTHYVWDSKEFDAVGSNPELNGAAQAFCELISAKTANILCTGMTTLLIVRSDDSRLKLSNLMYEYPLAAVGRLSLILL